MPKLRNQFEFTSSKVKWSVADFCSEKPSKLARVFAFTLFSLFPLAFGIAFFVHVPSGPVFDGIAASSNWIPLYSEFEISQVRLYARKGQFVSRGTLLASEFPSPPARGISSLDSGSVHANTSGIIMDISVLSGQKVKKTDLIAWILPTEFSGKIETIVPPSVLENLNVDEQVQVSYSRQGKVKTVFGKIAHIEPLLSSQEPKLLPERKVTVTIQPEDLQEPLLVGQEMKVRFKPSSESLLSAFSHRLLSAE